MGEDRRGVSEEGGVEEGKVVGREVAEQQKRVHGGGVGSRCVRERGVDWKEGRDACVEKCRRGEAQRVQATGFKGGDSEGNLGSRIGGGKGERRKRIEAKEHHLQLLQGGRGIRTTRLQRFDQGLGRLRHGSASWSMAAGGRRARGNRGEKLTSFIRDDPSFFIV